MSFTRLLKAAKVNLLAGVIGGTVLLTASLPAQTPKMAGTWQMDASRSQVLDGRSMLLVIESIANKIKVDATIHDRAGKETTAAFTCAPDGKECEFDEAGHKSKMSMWFNGDSLNVSKTDGPPGDVVDGWKMETSAEGKVLTLVVTHIDPTAQDETLVFIKKPS